MSSARSCFCLCLSLWFVSETAVFAAGEPQSPVQLQASEPKRRLCVAELGTALDAIAARPSLQRARMGMLVQPLNDANALYTREAQQFFLPASTTKVLTTAAALTALGPDYRIETTVRGVGEPPNLDAVRVIGQGDPSFSEQDLEGIAQTLRQQGIRKINNLIGDDTVFRGAAVVPSWEWEDLQGGWGSPVNSLMVNENAYEVRLYPQAVGEPLRLEWQLHEPTVPWRLLNRSRTVAESEPTFTEIVRRFKDGVLEIEVFGQLHAGGNADRSWMAVIDPGPYFLRRLKVHLERQGIKVKKTTLITDPNAQQPEREPERVLTTVQSPPLSELAFTINQYSNNLYAEAVLKTLGLQNAEQPKVQTNTPTLDKGLQVLEQTLTQLGVDPETYNVSDGSGLSRHNLISPEALVQTLALMDRSPHADAFRKSLRARALDGLPEDTVLAKTGGMTGVSNLSGYVRRSQLSPLAFTIFFNQYNQPRSQLKSVLDEMLVLLAQVKDCP